MSILLVGLNHNTAPVELREKIALQGCRLTLALEELTASRTPSSVDGSTSSLRLRESVILSTCNRMEIYAVTNGFVEEGWRAIDETLVSIHGIDAVELRPHLYYKADRDAVIHLMSVASGLDSLVLGEPQILGQVHQAYENARAAGATGPVLSHLCTQAVHAGKRARTETAISRHSTSISHAAANLAQLHLGNLPAISALIVGAGEMAQLAAHAMQQRGAGTIHVINRTYASAQTLAAEVNGCATPWHELPEMLAQVDVVFSATGAPHTVIHRTDVLSALDKRGNRPLVFIDVAVPRDIDEGVASLPGVTCFDVDDLQLAVDANLAQRQAEIPAVEAIIDQEVAAFEEWLRGREVAPTIVALRRKARALAEAEVEQASRRLADEDKEVLERLAHRLINKLLHEPTVRLKAHAAEGEGYAYAHVMRELFALDEAASDAAATESDHAASDPSMRFSLPLMERVPA